MDEVEKEGMWKRLTDWKKSPIYRYLIAQLKSKNTQTRRSAVDRKGATSCWAETLEDRNRWMRNENKNVWKRSSIYRYFKIKKLIAQLKSGDVDARKGAAERLGEIKDKRAVHALIETLEDEDENVRWRATEALGKIGDVSAVPALSKDLNDKDWFVQQGAAKALREIGDVSAVPALSKALKNKNIWVQESIAFALGEIGDSSAVPALIEALKVKNKHVRQRAAGALRRILEKCKTLEKFEEFEKGIDEGSAALRKGKVDNGILIDAQMKIAKLTSEIAKKKEVLTPKKDLLLDDKPKPPKKGRGIYHTARMIRNG